MKSKVVLVAVLSIGLGFVMGHVIALVRGREGKAKLVNRIQAVEIEAAARTRELRMTKALAIPALIEALDHPDPYVRSAIADALKRLTGKQFGGKIEDRRQWLKAPDGDFWLPGEFEEYLGMKAESRRPT